MHRYALLTTCTTLGSGAIGIILAAAGPAVGGCTTHECDQSQYVWPPGHEPLLDGGFTVGGYMLDQNTYVSNDLNQNWLDFPGNTTIQIYFPPRAACRVAKSPDIEIGTAETPNSVAAYDDGGNYVPAAGQPAILNELNTDPIFGPDGGIKYGGGLLLTNSSCALYAVHVEVDFAETEATTDARCRNAGGPVLPLNDAGATSLESGTR